MRNFHLTRNHRWFAICHSERREGSLGTPRTIRIVIPNRVSGKESAFQFRSSAVLQFGSPLRVSALVLGLVF